jgi:NADH dehydrogenase
MTNLPPLKTVIVAGAGYAGVLAANRLAGKLGDRARILLVSPTATLIDRIRLHEAAARGRQVEHALDTLLERRVVRLEARLVGIDPARRQISVEGGGARESLGYDALVLALGSRFAATIPAHSEHAFALAQPAAAHALARRLTSLPHAAPVAVVGGGLTAVELAAEIAEAHPRLEVSLYTGELLPALAGPARDALRAALTSAGVAVHEGCRVAELEPHALRFVDGTRRAVEVSVLAAGFAPASGAAELGLPEREDGRVAVDEHLCVRGLDAVFAVGDLAAPPADSVGNGLRTTRMGCASAMPMGAHAADQIVRLFEGRPLQPYHFQYLLQCISVGRRRGVIAFVDADDRPSGRVLAGRRGALLKELVCRFVIGALRLERLMAGLYAWPGQRWRVRLPGVAPRPSLPG